MDECNIIPCGDKKTQICYCVLSISVFQFKRLIVYQLSFNIITRLMFCFCYLYLVENSSCQKPFYNQAANS